MTQDQIDRIRAEFEKWAADKAFLIKTGDDYVNVRQMAWEAWQAAHARYAGGAAVATMNDAIKNAIETLDSCANVFDIIDETQEAKAQAAYCRRAIKGLKDYCAKYAVQLQVPGKLDYPVDSCSYEVGHTDGWNECIDTMLAAQENHQNN